MFVVHDNSGESDDADFVLDQVFPHLEDTHGYRLCLAQRDFIAGTREYIHMQLYPLYDMSVHTRTYIKTKIKELLSDGKLFSLR